MALAVIVLCLLLFGAPLDIAELPIISDEQLIEEIDKTTMLGQMARGTWDWAENPVACIP